MINTLERHKCWLVQSGRFKDEIKEIRGRNSIINLDYMGSAEFECGALPESTRRMLINIDFYDIFTFPQYVNDKGEELKIYAPKMFIEHDSKIVELLANNCSNRHLKEWCSLSQYLEGQKEYNNTDFWWDIENDFYIFFGNKNKELILEAQKAMRERTIGEVEIGNTNKLSEYYTLANQDLNEEAMEFLKSKRITFVKRLIKTFNRKIEPKK